MGQLIVGNLNDRVISALQSRAAHHGWSLEQEVRHILEDIAEDVALPPAGQILAELDQARSSTPAGLRRLAEDLIREDRDRL